jgi:hypothetical protein
MQCESLVQLAFKGTQSCVTNHADVSISVIPFLLQAPGARFSSCTNDACLAEVEEARVLLKLPLETLLPDMSHTMLLCSDPLVQACSTASTLDVGEELWGFLSLPRAFSILACSLSSACSATSCKSALRLVWCVACSTAQHTQPIVLIKSVQQMNKSIQSKLCITSKKKRLHIAERVTRKQLLSISKKANDRIQPQNVNTP